MAVTGVRQPNERILYDPVTDEPYFVRYSYAFEGLDGNSNTPPEPGEIIGQCRAAEDTSSSTPLPPASDTQFDLPQTRVDVRRYNRQTGQARIVVEYGARNFSGGAFPDVFSEDHTTQGVTFKQPYLAVVDERSGEISERDIVRPRMRTTIRRLKTDSGTLSSLITQNITDNLGRRMPWRGVNRIVVGGGFRPINQTQGYAYVVLDYIGPVDAVAGGTIVNENGRINLPIENLEALEVYEPVPSQPSGTKAEDLTITYRGDVIATFPWILQ